MPVGGHNGCVLNKIPEYVPPLLKCEFYVTQSSALARNGVLVMSFNPNENSFVIRNSSVFSLT